MVRRKKVFLGITALVVVLVLGAVGLRLAVNPDVFRPQIEGLVQQATGLTLRMEGPIRLSYFPWLGIELGKASLGGVPGFEQEPFVRLDGAVIRVRLSALLRGDLEADAIRLNGLDLTLIKAADGRTNWQSLPIKQLNLDNDKVVVQSDSGQTSFHYLFEGFLLKNGRLTYEDRASGSTLRLTDLGVTAGRVASGETSDVTLGFKLEADKPQLTVTTALKGKLTANPGDLVFRFDKADLDLKAATPDLPVHRLQGSGKADVTVDGKDGRILVRDLSLAATAAGGMFPEKGETAKLAGTFAYSSQSGNLVFSDLVLEGLGLRATGRIDGAVGKPGAAPRLVWQFATNTFSPKALLASLGITLTGLPEGALSSLETKGELVFSPSALGLTLSSLRLDGQNIAFSATVTDFDKPAVHFDLTADRLDAGPYLAAGVAGKAKGAKSAPADTAAPAPSTARIDGTIRVGRLAIKGLDLTQVQASVASADGTVAIKPFSFGLAGGNVSGGLTAATAKARSSLALAAKVANVAVKPVLVAATGKGSVSGTLSASCDVTASGANADALMGTLSGPVSFRLDNGAVEGFSVSPSLLASLKGLVGLVSLDPTALLRATGDFGQSLAASRQGSTAISRASASFQCKNGLATTRDLLVRASLGQVTGAGTVDLRQKQLHLDLQAKVSGVGTVPLLVEGPMQSPGVTVDKTALAKQAVTSVPSVLGKTLQDTGKGILNPMKGIFGGN